MNTEMSADRLCLNQFFFQQPTPQSDLSPEEQRNHRHSVSSSRSSKSSKQSLSKRQSLPTTIQERVAHGERYKTEMCKQFQLYNTCRYDNKCQYAHGEGELRSINRHPKYKTEQCRTYHTTGFCPYGARCHFVHDKDPSKPPQQSKKRRISISPTNEQKIPVQSELTVNQHDYQILINEQQQHFQQHSIEQLQMLHQLQRQQQQMEVERLLAESQDIWKPTYHLPAYSTSSTGSRSPLNSDSERSSPTSHLNHAPLYTLFHQGPASVQPLQAYFTIPSTVPPMYA